MSPYLSLPHPCSSLPPSLPTLLPLSLSHLALYLCLSLSVPVRPSLSASFFLCLSVYLLGYQQHSNEYCMNTAIGIHLHVNTNSSMYRHTHLHKYIHTYISMRSRGCKDRSMMIHTQHIYIHMYILYICACMYTEMY